MYSFFLGFVAGIGIILSLAGWGALVVKVLRTDSSSGFGFDGAVGLAFSTSVGGVLNLAQVVTPEVVRAYLLIGLVLAAFFFGFKRARRIREGVGSAWGYFRQRKLLAVVAFLFAVVTFIKYATVVSPGVFHPHDDYHAYFVFPVEMLQTGTLGQDPFSERRIVSSLGGNYFVDTFPLVLTGKYQSLRLLDEGVSFILLLVLLGEIMYRRRIPAHWILAVLLGAAITQGAVSNITCVYGGTLLMILLFELLDTMGTEAGLNHALLLAIVFAGLMSLKTTFAPIAGIFFISFYWFQLVRLPDKGKALKSAVVCGLFIFVLLVPWMIDSHRSSGTFFYPLLGKGFHGSRYGTYLLPTAHLGINNLLGFFDGLVNPMGGILAMEACLILLAYRRKKSDRLVELIIVINLVIDVVFIGIGIGGVQTYRYTFALLFAVALFLLIKEMALSMQSSASSPSFNYSEYVAPVLLLGVLIGGGFDQFMLFQKWYGFTQFRNAFTERNIVSPAEEAAYRNMQLAVPPGQKILVRLDKNFLLDFRRNIIYINDLPGGASLPPGIPIFKGPEALADYLLKHGIRYLAYSYGDEAAFSRHDYADRLKPNVNIWLRRGAQIAYDFQDNCVLLGKSRKKLFDDGHMFVLDLATPAQPPVASLAAPDASSAARRAY
jgi:hypothetical protein